MSQHDSRSDKNLLLAVDDERDFLDLVAQQGNYCLSARARAELLRLAGHS